MATPKERLSTNWEKEIEDIHQRAKQHGCNTTELVAAFSTGWQSAVDDMPIELDKPIPGDWSIKKLPA